MAAGQSPALSPDTADKYRRVVNLRKAGLTFDQIASEVGYASRAGAKEAYDAALKWWGREEVDQLRLIEGERLDELWRRTYTRLINADPDDARTFIGLTQTAVRISSARSALYGLEAPKQVELTGENGGAIQVDIAHVLVERIKEIADVDLSGVIDVEVKE